MDSQIIVTRHPAAIAFLLREIPMLATAPVLASATENDVRGRHVYGVVPLYLAAVAARVTVIEFPGAPPRGAEYDLADMDAAGARLRSYSVTDVTGITR